MQYYRSDIEEILQSQTWKHKHLHPISIQKRGFKVRCMSERDNPIKQERFITQTCSTISESQIDSPTPASESITSKPQPQTQPNMPSLPLPALLPIIKKEIFSTSSTSSFSSLSSKFNFQVPIFPKREFGDSTKSHILIPKFENLQKKFPDEAILEMKLESGRIHKKMPKTLKRKFTFLDDFNNLKSERAIERMKTIYLTAE